MRSAHRSGKPIAFPACPPTFRIWAIKEEKDEKGRFVRRERYMGSCQRSFYVGKNVKQEDIHASFENGVLKLIFPKKELPAAEEKKYITIK